MQLKTTTSDEPYLGNTTNLRQQLKAHSELMYDQQLIKSETPHIMIGLKLVPIPKITNKQIVNKLLRNTIKPATSIETWINVFPF